MIRPDVYFQAISVRQQKLRIRAFTLLQGSVVVGSSTKEEVNAQEGTMGIAVTQLSSFYDSSTALMMHIFMVYTVGRVNRKQSSDCKAKLFIFRKAFTVLGFPVITDHL